MSCYVEVPIEQEVDGVPSTGYNPFNFPVEGGYLPFFFTNETFTRVLSALVNGAMLTYGDEGMQVIWDFLVNVEFPVSFCELLIECIQTDTDVQQAIADLIATNEAVQSSIRDFVTSDQDINNYFTTNVQRLTSEQIAGAVVDVGCSNSNVAGAMLHIIDVLDGYNTDALQIIEVGTNDEERMVSLLSGIPVFGALPADEVLDVLQDVLEDFAENYAAAMTPEWKNEVAEDLYCLAKGKPDCRLEFGDLFDYFQTRATSGLDLLGTVYDLAQFITGGDFINDEAILSGMFAIQLAAVGYGNEFFGLKAPTMAAISRDASPSTAWEEWDECEAPPPEGCFDFTSGQHGFIPYFNGFVYYSEYSSGNGWAVEYNPGIIKFRKADMGGTITGVIVRFSEDVPTGINNQVTASNYNGTAPIYELDVEDDDAVLTGGNITSGLDIDLTFDGTLPSTFYIREICVTFAP